MTPAITGTGIYVPDAVVSGAAIAERSGIPEEVVVEKMGIVQKHVCPPDEDHVTDMSVTAAERALADAAVDPASIDLVCYHGSEYKDHIVWSAAADIAERLGATEAYAQETYALCAGAPIALRHVDAQLRAGDIETALLVGASREEDLVAYDDEDASFMFNFGSGASAFVVEAEAGGRARATLEGHDAITDGQFSRDVIMPAGGSIAPPSKATIEAGQHTLTVPDPEGMKERLGEVTLENFVAVADEALAIGGYDRSDIDFLAVTHMKRSFHDRLVEELGVDETGSHYLDHYGHVQSVDQGLAVHEATTDDRLASGDVVLFLAAGTGYTWAASALTWRG
ncbi:MAG: 3-oxoacyl-ACP synthase [Halobacteriaceae archaeon]